jgi:hypothetical protein
VSAIRIGQGGVRGRARRARSPDRLRLSAARWSRRRERKHTFIAGLANDEIGYQVPFAKWDNSCHACAPYLIVGAPQACPLFPNIDCNTVFENNVGQQVDPTISGAMQEAISRSVIGIARALIRRGGAGRGPGACAHRSTARNRCDSSRSSRSSWRARAWSTRRPRCPSARRSARRSSWCASLEVLAGSPGADEVRFAQHAHGAPDYAKGDEVLVFLQPASGPIPFVSIQEAGSGSRSTRATATRSSAAVRAYAGLEKLPVDARLAELRRLTVQLLGSPHAEIAASALRDLVIARDLPIVTREDVSVLEPLLSGARHRSAYGSGCSPSSSVGARGGAAALGPRSCARREGKTGLRRCAPRERTRATPVRRARAAAHEPGFPARCGGRDRARRAGPGRARRAVLAPAARVAGGGACGRPRSGRVGRVGTSRPAAKSARRGGEVALRSHDPAARRRRSSAWIDACKSGSAPCRDDRDTTSICRICECMCGIEVDVERQPDPRDPPRPPARRDAGYAA